MLYNTDGSKLLNVLSWWAVIPLSLVRASRFPELQWDHSTIPTASWPWPQVLSISVSVSIISLVVAVAAMTVRRRPFAGESQDSANEDALISPQPRTTVRLARPSTSPQLTGNWEFMILAVPMGLLLIYFVLEHDANIRKSHQPSSVTFACRTPDASSRLNDSKCDMKHRENFLPISTSSDDARKLFQMGLEESWNFNQIEAFRNFRIAMQLDPGCAMCVWGVAYSLSPYVNKVHPPFYECLAPGCWLYDRFTINRLSFLCRQH